MHTAKSDRRVGPKINKFKKSHTVMGSCIGADQLVSAVWCTDKYGIDKYDYRYKSARVR